MSIDAVIRANQRTILELAAKHWLPAIYSTREFVGNGGLMAYGVSYPDLYRRAATYIDKIFKGAKQADLPIEQPTRFELAINPRPPRRSASKCRGRCSPAPTR
jgi:putative ABC transport system substrate-binding protein